MRFVILSGALALAGCAQLGPQPRTDWIVAPSWACRAPAWEGLARTTPHPSLEEWWRMTLAATHATETTVCCLGPDGFASCPASLGLSYKELDEFNAARQAAAKAAQQATEGKTVEQQLVGPAKPAVEAPK